MVFGYVRVSKTDQTAEGQKSLIARYVVDRKLPIDEWIEVEMSSRKSAHKRRITELVNRVTPKIPSLFPSSPGWVDRFEKC